MLHKRFLPLVSALLLTITILPSQSQISIGLNFGADEPNGAATGTIAPDAVAGVVPQSNWNNLTGAAGSASDLVVDAAGVGSATSVSVEWSCPNTWSSTGRGEENNGFPDGGDRTIMTGYLDTTDVSSGVATVTVSGLDSDFTTGGYDVIVYALGGVAARGGAYTIGSTTLIGTGPASPTEHVEDPGVDLTDTGTYVRFRDLKDPSFTLVADASAPLGNFRAPINAIQIVAAPPPKKKILLVSDNAYSNSRAGTGDPEVEFVAFLEGLGYEVIRATGSGATAQFRDGNEGAAGAAAAGADLIIISRVTNSGDYDADPAAWNAIETPMLLLAPHIARNNRWLWFNTSGIVDDSLTDLVFVQPNHPFVQGLGTDIFDSPTPLTRIGTADPGNGTLIATDPAGNAALVEWEAGTEFYPGSGQIAAGQRVYLGGHRYFEDDPSGMPIQFEAYSENGKAILAQIITTLAPLVAPGKSYQEPDGGWAYKYDGDAVDAGSGGFTALDGTWSHDNGSDEWDGTGLGSGSPGGVSLLDDAGNAYVRIQDTGDPRAYGFADPGSTRKIYLGHSIDTDGFTGPILEDGFTLSFRAKIATGAPLDDQNPADGSGVVPWPTEGKGYLGHDGGKGNITVRQNGVGTISFSLGLPSDLAGLGVATAGINMNGLNGTSASSAVDPYQNEGTANVFPVDDLTTDWHEFWINIVADTSGGGTHRVDVYADGSETPQTFHVTAGTGSDFDGNYLAIGDGATPQMGAWDLDFVAYKPGIHLPRRTGAGVPVSFEEQPVSVTANEGDTVIFSAKVVGTPPRQLQWQRDGVDIPGATGTSYTIARAARGDDGAVFTLAASNPYGSAVSQPATLTVIPDFDPPRLIGGTGSATFDTITLTFNEPVDPGTAGDSFNYEINGGALGIQFATVSADGRTVTLTTDMQTEDTLYTVAIVEQIFDLAGNPTANDGSVNISLTSYVTGCGGLIAEVWDGISGTPVANLTGNSRFPNSPDRVFNIGRFDSREFFPDDTVDNYGARLRGLFIPNASGNWVFYLRSDDASQLFFNPNGVDAAGAQLVSEETGCCNAFSAHKTAPFPLAAGHGYYIEGLYKEGGGGDYIQVAATLDGAPVPTDPATESIPGTMLGFPAAPGGVAGDVVISQQPASQNVEENHPVTFSVVAQNDAGVPFCFQWQRDGVDIAGATGSSYSFSPTLADNGAAFRVKVGIIGSSTVSSVASLGVIPDTTAPQLVSAHGSGSLDTVTVVYDEAVDEATAGDPFNYEIKDASGNTLAVNAATLDGSDPLGRTYILSTGAQELDTDYTVTATGIADFASPPNFGDSSVSFRSYILSEGFARREFYFGLSTSTVTVDDLRADPNFPNNPGLVDYSTLLEGPVNAYDGYGERISGYLTPKVSGNYDFYMSSDDGGEFWLSTDSQPANLALVCFEPTWNGSRDWLGVTRRNAAAPENRSNTLQPDGIPLVAGQYYYFEALMKEGGGGDDIGVTGVLNGETPPVAPIDGSGLLQLAAPADPNGASVTITSQPQNAVVAVGCSDGGGDGTAPTTAYAPPSGGWSYLYDGSGTNGLGACKPSQALDNTWSANNGSSEWDGSWRGPGNGAPGGISSDGDVLTIEDVDQGSGSCNNRKVYFTHDVTQDIDATTASTLVDTGVTLSFRARLTQPDVDPMAEFPTPDGWGIFSGGKGMFGVRQSNPSSIVSFSFVRASEPDNGFNFSNAGLTMNRLNGDSPLNSEVNSSSTATDNPLLPLDPNQFHEFWITIQANDATAGNGTHTVNIYMDGSLTPATFNVTAGTGNEGSTLNMIAMGLNNSGGRSAMDVDFFGYKPGVFEPQPTAPLEGTPVSFSVAATGAIPGNDNAPLFVQWQKNDQDILGAVGLTYATTVNAADAGATFRARINTPGASLISDAAVVMVNHAPQVAITSPANGDRLKVGTTVTIAANAQDADGTVAQVEFFAEGVGSLGVDTTGGDGWSVQIPDAPLGVFNLTAVATDNLGASCTSEPVLVEVIDNEPPVCEEVVASANEDEPTDITLLASDPDNDPLVYAITADPAHGSVTVNGSVATYLSAPDYNGPDQFGFKVTDPTGESSECVVHVTVLPVPDAPVCSDTTAVADEDVPVAISLPATDADGDALTAVIVSGPSQGTVSVSGTTATYQGNLNYNGTDSFTYKVVDATGLESGECTVSVTINAVNDPPTPVIKVSPLSDLGPTVPGLIVISPDNTGACATLDGTASSDVEGDPIISYLWLVDGEPVGTEPVIDTCLLVGARTVTLRLDDGQPENNIGEASVTVDVVTGSDAVEELIMVVNDSVVERKNKQPFLATLKTAAAAFERGSFGSAINRLQNAFMNKVDAQIGRNNPDVAAEWKRIAQEILDAFTREQNCPGCE